MTPLENEFFQREYQYFRDHTLYLPLIPDVSSKIFELISSEYVY